MLVNVGVLASMALAANAILLPPQLAADNPDDDKAMEALVVDPFKRSVALECPGCPSASLSGDAVVWTQDTGNTFRLDFQTGPFEDTLEIDGLQIYPPPFGSSMFESFYITQINPDNPEVELIRLRVSGYRLDYSSAETVTEGGIELLPVTFRIQNIEQEAVNPPALAINLLKDSQGRLMIASIDTAPEQQTEKECDDWPLLCKWRSTVAEKFNSMKNSMRKGCHKNKGHGAEEQMGHNPHHELEHTEGEDRPHHRHGHHGHHHGDHHHHRMHMFLRRAFFTILIPILIGVIAGTITYLIGMALGCVIAIIVAKVRGRRAYQPVSLEDGDDGEEQDEPRGEKEGFVELPEYDSPPVYEEAAEKEVVDEAR